MYSIFMNGIYKKVSGTEAAWAAYNRAVVLKDMLGWDFVALIDGETGEVLIDSTGYVAD